MEMLINSIVKGELSYYKATGSAAYLVQYEDGEKRIFINPLSARDARTGIDFEILASARWADHQGNPSWTIYDADGEAVASVSGDEVYFY